MVTRKSHEKVVEYIRVDVVQGKAGLYYATSNDLEGLFVAAKTIDALRDEVTIGITALYRASGRDVTIAPAEPAGSERRHEVREPIARQWVAIPTGIDNGAFAHC
jgi:hypothetical protein